jgi:hypothetical protein
MVGSAVKAVHSLPGGFEGFGPDFIGSVVQFVVLSCILFVILFVIVLGQFVLSLCISSVG